MFVFSGHKILNAFFFSGLQNFEIELTVNHDYGGPVVLPGEVLDLSTPVWGYVYITNSAGVPQGLDVHLREVTATDGTDEVVLIRDG